MNNEFLNIIFFLLGLIILLISSGKLVFYIINSMNHSKKIIVVDTAKIDTGFIIGKCENILIYLFVWSQDFTALALIFAAKTIVRQEDIKKDSLYYLAGTMINFTYSILCAVGCKYLYKVIINNYNF